MLYLEHIFWETFHSRLYVIIQDEMQDLHNSVQHSLIDHSSLYVDPVWGMGEMMINTNLGHDIGGNRFNKYFM